MTDNRYRLFDNLPSDRPIAFRNGVYIDREIFKAHVFSIARKIPEHQYAINICEDRYAFLVAFVACMLKEQTSLLPPNRSKNEIKKLGDDYSNSYIITDEYSSNDNPNRFIVKLSSADFLDWPDKEINNELIAAIVFTSGSTGDPRPYPKRWKNLVSSALKVKHQLNLDAAQSNAIVATVPPQHMFGFEMSIIYPLVNNTCIHCGNPFYPYDIKNALSEVPKPRILVTTPLHLRACIESGLNWPTIDSAISATAPLPEELATTAEERMQVKVQEIYGCSEVGAIATRRSTQEPYWKLLEGYRLTKRLKRFWLQGSGFEEDIQLPDQFSIKSENQFSLIGRDSDMVKIGGKRGSLANLTSKLKGLDGIKDGVFFVPDIKDNKRIRLAALVIAPGLTEEDILARLVDSIDQIFLPKPLLIVDHLPYNEMGKLPRTALLSTLNRFRQTRPLLEIA
jgi:acyl-coenzyme A synthetase/AMP-(fatty) acid ligase